MQSLVSHCRRRFLTMTGNSVCVRSFSALSFSSVRSHSFHSPPRSRSLAAFRLLARTHPQPAREFVMQLELDALIGEHLLALHEYFDLREPVASH